MKTIEDFYAAAAERFTPGGPGRVDWHMSDREIVEMLKITAAGYEKTGALFVVPTPAGIVAVKPIEPPGALGCCAHCESTDVEHVPGTPPRDERLHCRQCGATWLGVREPLEDELRPGRHDHGYSRGRRMSTRAGLSQISSAGDAIVRAGR